MTARYRFVARLSPGLVRIERTGNDGRIDVAMWDKAKLRRPRICVVTGLRLDPGDAAYRPLNNSLYRSERIAPTGIAQLARDADQ